jgi:hypothetical protein
VDKASADVAAASMHQATGMGTGGFYGCLQVIASKLM